MSKPKTLAERVTRLRRERDLTACDIERLTGLGTDQVYRIERGEVTNPNLATLRKLADALGVNVGDLVD